MPASKSEMVMAALHALIDNATFPTLSVLRNEVLPVRLPRGGLAILRDGDPGEPEVTMSPLQYHYERRASLEVFTAGPDRGAAFDAIAQAIGLAIEGDRTLGGLCDWVEPEAPEPQDLPVEGADTIKAAAIPIVLHYSTSNPLT
jgi:hypothetical protein